MIWLVRLLFFFALLALVSPARCCSTLRLLLLQHLLLLLLLPLLCAWATSKSPHKPPNDFVALGRQPARPQKQPKTRTSGVSCAESRIYPPVLSYSPPFPNPPALSVCAISECRLNLNLPRLQGGGREREAWHDCLLFGPLIFCFFACLASARCFLSNGFSIIIPNSKL